MSVTKTKDQLDRPYNYFGVHFTSWCMLGCEHCFTNSSPKANRTVVDENLVEALAKCTLRRNPRAKMVITGGEPLAQPKRLLSLIRRISNLGVNTVLHTNGYWGGAKWIENALQEMITCGLTHVNLSTDDYHLKKLSIKKFKAAANTITNLGISLRIPVTFGASSKVRPENVLELTGIPNNQLIDVVPVSLVKSGGATSMPKEIFSTTDHVGWCPKLINPVIFSNGDLSPCSGSAFSSICHRNTWPEQFTRPKTEKEIERCLSHWEREPLLDAIAHSGPMAVHQKMLQTNGWEKLEPLTNGGSCECESCNKLFSDARLRLPLAKLRELEVERWAFHEGKTK